MSDQDPRPPRFSMIREFSLADLITLGNGACGVVSIFLCLQYLADDERRFLWTAFFLLPTAFVLDALDGWVARKVSALALLLSLSPPYSNQLQLTHLHPNLPLVLLSAFLHHPLQLTHKQLVKRINLLARRLLVLALSHLDRPSYHQSHLLTKRNGRSQNTEEQRQCHSEVVCQPLSQRQQERRHVVQLRFTPHKQRNWKQDEEERE